MFHPHRFPLSKSFLKGMLNWSIQSYEKYFWQISDEGEDLKFTLGAFMNFAQALMIRLCLVTGEPEENQQWVFVCIPVTTSNFTIPKLSMVDFMTKNHQLHLV